MTGFFFKLINEDPLLAVTTTGYELEGALPHLASIACGRTAYLLLSVNWHLPHQMEHLLEKLAWVRSHAPNIHVTVMAATEEDDRLCRSFGVDSFFCNHNCLISEHIFQPDPSVEKRFDAVYTGRLAPMKRHELAFQVKRLAVISGSFDVDDAYVAQLMEGFEDLAWSNYASGTGLSLLSNEETARVLQMSRCGLALSDLEGAMFASIEYLMCGLPVVTTPSVGGRDVFFDPEFVTTVPADPDQVAQAVSAFVDRAIDPLTIRARTLQAIRPHRMRLLLRLSSILQRNLFLECDKHLWHPLMEGKMRGWVETAGTVG